MQVRFKFIKGLVVSQVNNSSNSWRGGKNDRDIPRVLLTDLGDIRVIKIGFWGVGRVNWEMSIGDDEEVREIIGSVGPEYHLVDGQRSVGVDSRGRREPVDSERRPFEGVRDDEIVEKRCILLPYVEVLF